MTKEYDAVLIGGGASLKIARPAADLGLKIAVVEPGPLGGTCLNRGCIPSKMLIHPADVIQQLKEASNVDVHFEGEIKIDFKKLVNYVTDTVQKESKSIEPLFNNHHNLDFYPQQAKFISPNEIQVGDEVISGKKVFIVTGARPYIPSIEGLEGTPYMTSTTLLKRDTLPKKVIIIGAGYIACELGHYLDAMGAEVHYVVRSKFLRHLDEGIEKHFSEAFSKRFQVCHGEPSKVSYENEEFSVYVGEDILKADALLIASGVTPNSDCVGLEHTQVECDERGFIKVDDHLETTQKGVFAFGDIIGRCLFRHTANFEGEYLLYEQFENPKSLKKIEYPPVPYGVFTWPQIAGVGKLEKELKEEGVDYIVGRNSYLASAMGMALRSHVGFVKLLFERSSLKLIGAHIIGEQATTMIHMLIAYMNCKATLHELLSTIYIHPALPEIVRNAARNARKKLEEEKKER